jgi:hypothetical protein
MAKADHGEKPTEYAGQTTLISAMLKRNRLIILGTVFCLTPALWSPGTRPDCSQEVYTAIEVQNFYRDALISPARTTEFCPNVDLRS